jgi:copper ion binding protein
MRGNIEPGRPAAYHTSYGVSMSDSDQQTYSVTGMTCEHCVAAVSTEVGDLPGVSSVDVDLASGVVVVHGSSVDGEAVRGAIEAAGYSLA